MEKWQLWQTKKFGRYTNTYTVVSDIQDWMITRLVSLKYLIHKVSKNIILITLKTIFPLFSDSMHSL